MVWEHHCLLFVFDRDSPVAGCTDQETIADGGIHGEWRRPPRLPHQRWCHRHAQGRPSQQFWGRQDPVRWVWVLGCKGCLMRVNVGWVWECDEACSVAVEATGSKSWPFSLVPASTEHGLHRGWFCYQERQLFTGKVAGENEKWGDVIHCKFMYSSSIG